jgi:hypothetical protein
VVAVCSGVVALAVDKLRNGGGNLGLLSRQNVSVRVQRERDRGVSEALAADARPVLARRRQAVRCVRVAEVVEPDPFAHMAVHLLRRATGDDLDKINALPRSRGRLRRAGGQSSTRRSLLFEYQGASPEAVIEPEMKSHDCGVRPDHAHIAITRTKVEVWRPFGPRWVVDVVWPRDAQVIWPLG